MKKAVVLFFCAITVTALLCSCFYSRVLFETDKPEDSEGILKMETVEILNPPVDLGYERSVTEYTSDDIMSYTRAVVMGKVTDVEEVRITYLDYESSSEQRVIYMTKFELYIEDIYYLSQKNDFAAGDKICVWYPNTTHGWSDELPLIKNNDEIFVFLTSMYSTFTDFGRYVTIYPDNLLFVKTDGHWDFTNILNVFGTEMWGIEEGEVPVLGMMHEFFGSDE